MTGTSKEIMGAAVAMVVTLAIVLGLVLVLLAELYCSLLLRGRHHRNRASTATAVGNDGDTEQHSQQPNALSLCSFYAQGVLRAPRSILFPGPENQQLDLEKQPPHILINSTPSPSYPRPIVLGEASPPSASTCSAGKNKDQLIYICNPIYDDEAINRIISKVDSPSTPFETPGTSPSHLETAAGSPTSSRSSSLTTTPPLTPMKKLPPEGPSVSLRDARSICTTGSTDSNSNNDGISSSSSGSPCTSPSW